MIYDSPQETKHNIDFQYPQGVYFLEKYNGLSKSGFSLKNLGILLAKLDHKKDHMKINFE